MSSRTWLLGFQWLWSRFMGVSASGVLLTLEWGCGSGSHWSDVCHLSGSFHTLHMAKVRGRGQIPMGFQDYWICFFTSIPAWQPKATMWGKKERNPEQKSWEPTERTSADLWLFLFFRCSSRVSSLLTVWSSPAPRLIGWGSFSAHPQ